MLYRKAAAPVWHSCYILVVYFSGPMSARAKDGALKAIERTRGGALDAERAMLGGLAKMHCRAKTLLTCHRDDQKRVAVTLFSFSTRAAPLRSAPFEQARKRISCTIPRTRRASVRVIIPSHTTARSEQQADSTHVRRVAQWPVCPRMARWHRLSLPLFAQGGRPR